MEESEGSSPTPTESSPAAVPGEATAPPPEAARAAASTNRKRVAAAALAARKRKGRKPGSTSFKRPELETLLPLIENILPICATQWQQIEDRHAVKWPEKNRTHENLKRKFNALVAKKIKTGDPNIPWEVKEAKRIHRLIEQEIDAANDGAVGDEDIGLLDDDEDDPDFETNDDNDDIPGQISTAPRDNISSSNSSTTNFKGPRPLVTPRGANGRRAQNKIDINEFLMASLADRAAERREEAKRREEDRRLREEERKEDEQRRREEREQAREERRHEMQMQQQMMMTMLTALAGNNKKTE